MAADELNKQRDGGERGADVTKVRLCVWPDDPSPVVLPLKRRDVQALQRCRGRCGTLTQTSGGGCKFRAV